MQAVQRIWKRGNTYLRGVKELKKFMDVIHIKVLKLSYEFLTSLISYF